MGRREAFNHHHPTYGRAFNHHHPTYRKAFNHHHPTSNISHIEKRSIINHNHLQSLQYMGKRSITTTQDIEMRSITQDMGKRSTTITLQHMKKRSITTKARRREAFHQHPLAARHVASLHVYMKRTQHIVLLVNNIWRIGQVVISLCTSPRWMRALGGGQISLGHLA
eukprot:scaffold247861_cov41-Tisochrysis_lutea.AAC.2